MASIKNIFDIISATLNASRTPPPEIPSVLLLAGAKLRVGLSPLTIASRIIARQVEAGAPVGVLPSGGKNISEIMYAIIVEEIINSIQTEGRVDVAIDMGIPLTAEGVGADGIPVTTVGRTIGVGTGKGIIR